MRLHQIDALRGFALFGILVVNIFVYHAPYAHYFEFYSAFEGLESGVVENMIFFFGGKFMFIYAFLFGYSFWIQYQKMEDASKFVSFWNRRMSILAIFGILHVSLLFFGDILLPYALLGLSLPFFAKRSNRFILMVAIIVYLIPVYEYILRGFVDYAPLFMSSETALEEYIRINQNGTYLDILQLRLNDYLSFRNEKLIFYIPKELTLFLLGMVAAKAKLATNLPSKPWIIFCVIGLLSMIGMYFYQSNLVALFDQSSFIQRSLLGLTIQATEFMHGATYIIGFFLLWKVIPVQKVLMFLSYPGKLSLTNYLSQSLICMILFNGFNLYSELKPSSLIITVFAIYGFQLLFSYMWLKWNTQGPLEYVWRKLAKPKNSVSG